MKEKIIALVVCLLVFSVQIIMAQGEPCQGNFDYDQDVDADDVTVFLEHFGRNQYNDPCPPSGPAMLPKTGQTTDYFTGDDGDLEKGVELPNPRFKDNGDGTIADNLTALIWTKDAHCFGTTRTWTNALSDCNGLASGACGLTDGSNAGDWRLPNVRELQSLMHYGYHAPPLSNIIGDGQWSEGDPFTNLRFSLSDYYWTSTTYSFPQHSDVAWVIYMIDSDTGGHSKTWNHEVWCVRDGFN